MIYTIQDIINGILMGSIYGLTAMGLTVIFGVLKVINFAHGSLLMVAMYVAYWAVALTGVHPYLMLIVVIPVMFLFGLLPAGHCNQADIQGPSAKCANPSPVIIVTTGVWYILDNLALMLFTPKYRALLDNPLKGRMLEYGEMLIEVPKLYGFVAALVTTGVLYWFFQKTRLGRAVRATSLDRDAASLMGINQYRMYNIAFGIGAATAGVAAVYAGALLQRVPHGGRVVRHQGIHHCSAGRFGKHRRCAVGRHYYRVDRIGHPGVHGRYVERVYRVRSVPGLSVRTSLRPVRPEAGLVGRG